MRKLRKFDRLTFGWLVLRRATALALARQAVWGSKGSNCQIDEMRKIPEIVGGKFPHEK